LLLMAAVLIKILVQAEFIDAGYDSEHLAFIEYAMPYPRALLEELGRAPKTVADLERIQAKARELREKRNLSDRRLLERARANPDFTAVALTDSLPLNPVHAGIVEREDFYKTKQLRWVSTASVSPDYFQVLGISVLRGRLFDERDIIAEPRRVVIVCEALAGMLWPGQNPIGRYLAFSWPGSTLPPQWLEVVGVVNEVKPPLSGGGPNPFLYVPLGPGSSGAEFLLARGYESPSRLVKGLTASINEANPAVEIVKGQTMSDAIREALYPRRMAGAMLAVSGIIGLLLASVGIYGVVSYSVAQRFKEIGIRAALGARKNNILKLVIGEGVKVAMLGSFLGLPLAIAAIRITSHFVVQFPTIDWMTMIAVPAFLGAVILLACYFPARRAARVDPMVALREL
jgi:putative ABC transport system permease protein